MKLRFQTPGRSFSTAIPALVSCAVPNRWISVQRVAVASQKFTWPVVNVVDPLRTEAVSVMTVPEGAEVTAVPPEVTVRLVDVAILVCAKAKFPMPQTASTHIEKSVRRLLGSSKSTRNFEKAEKGWLTKRVSGPKDLAPKRRVARSILPATHRNAIGNKLVRLDVRFPHSPGSSLTLLSFRKRRASRGRKDHA